MPVFAHGAPGAGVVLLILWIGASLALGTITVLVTAAINKKWNWGTLLIWLLSIFAWAVAICLIWSLISWVDPQDLGLFAVAQGYWIVASLVMGTITAAVFTWKKKWSWGTWLLSVITWLVALFLVINI